MPTTLFGTAVPSEVERLFQSLCSADWPDPTDLVKLLDAQAILACRSAKNPTARVTDAYADRLEAILGQTQAMDDGTAAAVLAVLPSQRLDAPTVAAWRRGLTARIDSTGLLRPAAQDRGSVASTTSSPPPRRASPASPATPSLLGASVDALRDRARTPRFLRVMGDERWRSFAPLARSLAQRQPKVVTAASLGAYLAQMEVATQLVDQLRLASLADFDPGDDEALQRSAASAIARPTCSRTRMKSGSGSLDSSAIWRRGRPPPPPRRARRSLPRADGTRRRRLFTALASARGFAASAAAPNRPTCSPSTEPRPANAVCRSHSRRGRRLGSSTMSARLCSVRCPRPHRPG